MEIERELNKSEELKTWHIVLSLIVINFFIVYGLLAWMGIVPDFQIMAGMTMKLFGFIALVLEISLFAIAFYYSDNEGYK